MNTDISLTPAQVDFIRSVLPSFTLDSWNIELAGRAASQRYFVRISKKAESYVLVVWDSRDEDWSRFLSIQKDLLPIVPYLPAIYHNDPVHGLILEEDLGAQTLKKFCYENISDQNAIITKYKQVLEALRSWQKIDKEASLSIAARTMDVDTFLWETDYFAHFCVKDFCACEKMLNDRWNEERNKLARIAASLPQTCIHRDFQSENVMIHNGSIRFVDYQGARIGPPAYDTASLLFDPYIEMLTADTIGNLFSYYSFIDTDKKDEHTFYICAAQRLMQALGAYGNLALHKGKEWYRDYIPLALDRLVSVMDRLPEFGQIGKVAKMCQETLVQNMEKAK